MRTRTHMHIYAMKLGNVVAVATLAALVGCTGRGDIPGPVVQPLTEQHFHAHPQGRILTVPFSVLTGVNPRSGTMQRMQFVNTAALATSYRTIAVSDASNEVVHVYNSLGTQLAQLTGFFEPQGMSSDAKGSLYVADTGNQRVQIYAAGFTGQPATLADPVGFPSDVDSYSAGQIVAVANIYNAPCCAQGSVSFFNRGTLVNTISDPILAKAYFCAFDASGNLYVDGIDVNNNFVVGEIIGGAHGRRYTPLATTNHILSPGGIQITTSGQVAILDQNGATIYTYDAPHNGSLGSPVATTKLMQSNHAVAFAFTRTMAHVYTADAGIFASQEFMYPAGGDAIATINVGGQTSGIALLPSQVPIH